MNKKEELTLKAIDYLRKKDLYDVFILFVEKSRVIFDDDSFLSKEYTINEMYELVKHETKCTKIDFSKKIKHLVRLGFIVYHKFRDNTLLNKLIIESESFDVSPYYKKISEYEANNTNIEDTKLIVSYDAYISGDDVYSQIKYDTEMDDIKEEFVDAFGQLIDSTKEDKGWLKSLSSKAGQGITIIMFVLLILGIFYIFLKAIGIEITEEIDEIIKSLLDLK